ncbi:hypothetical protein MFU01_08140 [Myxococcus fulvus]|uniref:Uncharacterized protein n=1 Tax=Myxococcus fulvus TaxID=33 RepID=A0A511SW50_MYXFU|nr:hypothetical protein MFU01_08140 [Myxococcus fulvus]
MRDVVDAGKRALAIHRGVVLPHRAEFPRGDCVQHLSAASGGRDVPDILRALESCDSSHGIEADWECLHLHSSLQEV